MLENYEKTIVSRGPNRVLLNDDGLSVSPKVARERHRTEPDIIFIRNDGWSLGAPLALEESAYRLWEDCWIGVLRRGSTVATRIESYQPSQGKTKQ